MHDAKGDNPYQPPTASDPCSTTRPPVSALAWWEARRLYYNIGLVVAGILAFICYVVVCGALIPRVLDASSEIVVDISTSLLDPFPILFQGVCYLLMMVIANVFYFLGPISECIFKPTDVERYRRVCYRLGFWFSVLLPFGIPALLAFNVIFFPERFPPMAE
ncbi:MAG: hypothetical protein FWC56_01485 [Phycisphaerae bacterium]|nr:hypothetical protein [Phycisphaerae bacterium]